LVFSVYELAEASGKGNPGPVESTLARVPVLLNNDDETVEVAWSQRLPKGVYRLEIGLFGNDGDIIERRETIIESDLSKASNMSAINSSNNEAVNQSKKGEKGVPGFSLVAGITGLVALSIFLRKKSKVNVLTLPAWQ
ncbi:MAG: hypothetical protein WB014_10400, partial [Methanosarcina sp.]